MDSIMYSPNDHNTAFACYGEKFLFKKPLNYSHTTFLTLCQDKFKLELIDTNLVNFWVGYQKLLFYTTLSCLRWLSLLQFIFLFICNPTICNPGPISSPQFKTSSDLSIFYQNVQGLIPFSNLAQDHPKLDNNKIFELNAYINSHNPEVIIINETWLKPSILDSEIFPPDKYEIHRLVRSEKTHPIDPLNSKKYRRNGGVLIAINVSLSVESKTIPTNCSAELLAIELTLPNKTKIISYEGLTANEPWLKPICLINTSTSNFLNLHTMKLI